MEENESLLAKQYNDLVAQRQKNAKPITLNSNDYPIGLAYNSSDQLVDLNQAFIQIDEIENSFMDVDTTNVSKKAQTRPKKVENIPVLDRKYSFDDRDSDKMQNVKFQINRYQEVRGTEMEGPVLQQVIAACDKYTAYKFSWLKFGEASKRLRFVKNIRSDARLRLLSFNAKATALNKEQGKKFIEKQRALMVENHQFFDPEIKLYDQMFITNKKYPARMQNLRHKIALIKNTYPTITNEDAEKMARIAYLEGIKTKDMTTEWMDKKTREITSHDDLVVARLELELERKENSIKMETQKKYSLLSDEDLDSVVKDCIYKNIPVEDNDIIKDYDTNYNKYESAFTSESPAEVKTEIKYTSDPDDYILPYHKYYNEAREQVLREANPISRFFMKYLFGSILKDKVEIQAKKMYASSLDDEDQSTDEVKYEPKKDDYDETFI